MPLLASGIVLVVSVLVRSVQLLLLLLLLLAGLDLEWDLNTRSEGGGGGLLILLLERFKVDFLVVGPGELDLGGGGGICAGWASGGAAGGGGPIGAGAGLVRPGIAMSPCLYSGIPNGLPVVIMLRCHGVNCS